MEDKKIRKSLKTHITVLTLTIFVIVFLPILAFLLRYQLLELYSPY